MNPSISGAVIFEREAKGSDSMHRNLRLSMLSLLALLFATLLLIDVAWFVHGSLELFATDEQQGKIRIIAVLSGCSFALAEATVLFRLRRLLRDRAREATPPP
jgi:uncharacterized membrane protein YqjE